jgi:hypothetical protein
VNACEFGLSSDQEAIDRLTLETSNLQVLCETMAETVNKRIVQLERQIVMSYLSCVEQCRHAETEAASRYEILPDDPFLRIEGVRKILDSLQSRHTQLVTCYQEYVQNVSSTTTPEDPIQFKDQFPNCQRRYQAEKKRHAPYFAAIACFNAVLHRVQSTVHYFEQMNDAGKKR